MKEMITNIEQVQMDVNKIVAALKATIDPTEREAAETYLTQVQQIIGFAPTLLQIITSEQVECPVRQAGTIYLKNLITSYWEEKSVQNICDEQENTKNISLIHEQDRHSIRETIVEAIIHSPEVIRVQLAACASKIIKVDFPSRWSAVVDKIVSYLNTTDANAWMGALTVLHQLVKAYEFKKPEEREPLTQAMKIVLPILYKHMIILMQDPSQEANYLQKIILKIFYALVQISLNLNMISYEEFTQWMELVRQIVERSVPAETLEVDIEDRPNLIWWKCKKWAMRLMTRIFERYGNPGQVSSEYHQFADFYLKNFVSPSIQTVLKLLDAYRKKEYVSPIVLFQALSYLTSGVDQSFSWKLLKQHMIGIITDIIFPLACHSDQDEELWKEDQQEYIRQKYDLMEEITNPTSAAMGLLSECVKRKDLLSKVVQFICHVLNNPESSPRHLDGALHMIGVLAPNLLKKKIYKAELENMLVAHVFPRMQSPHGFLRSRACWCIQVFSEVNFKTEDNLVKAASAVLNALLSDPEMPVKVEAALAIQMLLSDQPKIERFVETQIKPICLALLNLINETENDELTTVVQKLINTYTEQIIPIAVEIAQHLAGIFSNLLENDDGEEDRAMTAIGVLNTLQVVMDAVDEHETITRNLEPVVIGVIEKIFNNNIMEFYEEACVLLNCLTVKYISPACWQLFLTLSHIFDTEAIDYFTDMMPALHNFVTVDPNAFLQDPERLRIVFGMCKKILTEDISEDTQCHSAKLLEVVVLQFKGCIDSYIRPVCEVVLGRLTQEISSSELRTMCLQVLIAILHYNPVLMLQTLQTFQSPDASMSLVDLFIKQWLCDADCFLGVHDRKMYLIGLSILIGMPVQERPPVMLEMCNKLLPSCLTLYDGLQKAYEQKAKRENEDDESDSGEDEELDGEALASDEEEIDDEGQEHMDKEQDSGNDDVFSEDDDDFVDETDLEAYETVLDGESAEIDEYVFFKETLLRLEHTEPQWYAMLVSHMNHEQVQALQNIFNLADQRKAAAESQKIDKSGGYKFNVNQNLPMTFNFGGAQFS